MYRQRDDSRVRASLRQIAGTASAISALAPSERPVSLSNDFGVFWLPFWCSDLHVMEAQRGAEESAPAAPHQAYNHADHQSPGHRGEWICPTHPF
jgi:hypothetical protein